MVSLSRSTVGLPLPLPLPFHSPLPSPSTSLSCSLAAWIFAACEGKEMDSDGSATLEIRSTVQAPRPTTSPTPSTVVAIPELQQHTLIASSVTSIGGAFPNRAALSLSQRQHQHQKSTPNSSLYISCGLPHQHDDVTTCYSGCVSASALCIQAMLPPSQYLAHGLPSHHPQPAALLPMRFLAIHLGYPSASSRSLCFRAHALLVW